MIIDKILEPNVITEITPLEFEKYKQYKIENKSDNSILIWVGTANPHVGNESFSVDPKTHESRYFRGQQILAMSTKKSEISVTVK